MQSADSLAKQFVFLETRSPFASSRVPASSYLAFSLVPAKRLLVSGETHLRVAFVEYVRHGERLDKRSRKVGTEGELDVLRAVRGYDPLASLNNARDDVI